MTYSRTEEYGSVAERHMVRRGYVEFDKSASQSDEDEAQRARRPHRIVS